LILPLFRTTESVCLFLDSISLGTVKVKIYDADLKVIEKLIGRKKAMESCDKKGKKVSEASIRKAENDNLSQLFKTFPLFGAWPQVLKRILLVSNEIFYLSKIINIFLT
jgi:hypothetical protein